MTKAAMKHLKSGGCIINTSSVVAYKGHDTLIDYSMTKGAIVTFTRSLATALAKGKCNIRVNAVAPGVTRTDMLSALPKEMVDRISADIPLGRVGEPEDIANAYLFLASDVASYITGQVVKVDGGARV